LLTRAKRLKLIVNNTRFLVLDETREPNLASQSLGTALRALPAQWQDAHGTRRRRDRRSRRPVRA
jgi:hypothetical protein